MRFPGYRKLMWVLLVTQMFPRSQYSIVPMYQILSDLQLIDSYLGLILVNCTTIVPYCAWLMKGYFDTSPFEAGRVDGLTPFGTLRAADAFPLAKPGLAVARSTASSRPSVRSRSPRHFMLSDDKYTFASVCRPL
ncbi:ABC transporter permease [Streptomyces purpurascens]